MVGNDVVDLRDPDTEPSTLGPGFDKRVFSGSELEGLRQSRDPVCQRWRLWAAKEAAYKLVRKLRPRVVFSPSRFFVELPADAGGECDTAAGSVLHEGVRYPVRVTRREGAIHAISAPRLTGARGLVHGCRRLEPHELDERDPEAATRAVRRLCLESLALPLRVRASDLEVRRRGRIPELWLRGARAAADLSLSHHGSLVAFACSLAPVARG